MIRIDYPKEIDSGILLLNSLIQSLRRDYQQDRNELRMNLHQVLEDFFLSVVFSAERNLPFVNSSNLARRDILNPQYISNTLKKEFFLLEKEILRVISTRGYSSFLGYLECFKSFWLSVRVSILSSQNRDLLVYWKCNGWEPNCSICRGYEAKSPYSRFEDIELFPKSLCLPCFPNCFCQIYVADKP